MIKERGRGKRDKELEKPKADLAEQVRKFTEVKRMSFEKNLNGLDAWEAWNYARLRGEPRPAFIIDRLDEFAQVQMIRAGHKTNEKWPLSEQTCALMLYPKPRGPASVYKQYRNRRGDLVRASVIAHPGGPEETADRAAKKYAKEHPEDDGEKQERKREAERRRGYRIRERAGLPSTRSPDRKGPSKGR